MVVGWSAFLNPAAFGLLVPVAGTSDFAIGTVSRVELLIENAKMTARLDAQNELIGELREDKKFMREQIVHNRQNDTLMSDMHRETLQTLKAVSVAGRHTKIEMPSVIEFRDALPGRAPCPTSRRGPRALHRAGTRRRNTDRRAGG